MIRMLWAIIGIAVAFPVAAEESPSWRPVDAQTGRIADLASLEQLALDFPDSSSVRLRLLQAQLSQDETGAQRSSAILESLRWFNQRGYVFSEPAQAQLPELLGAEYSTAASELLIAEPEVKAASEVVATLPPELGLVESVSVVGDTGILFVSSVSENAIFIVSPGQDPLPIPLPQAHDPSGLVVDTQSETIWVALGNVDGSEEPGSLFAGVMGIKEDLNWSPLLPAPSGVNPSDLAVSASGALYVSDPIGGGVYTADEAGQALEPLIEPKTLRSPQGLVASADGNTLYVSDYRYGIAMVDLTDRRVSRLSTELPIMMDGVDALWRVGDELIAVQNGISPMRISAFKLSADGRSVIGHRILEQAHPGWTEPLGGSVIEGSLYYVGTGQWDRFENGQPIEGAAVTPTEIRRLLLD